MMKRLLIILTAAVTCTLLTSCLLTPANSDEVTSDKEPSSVEDQVTDTALNTVVTPSPETTATPTATPTVPESADELRAREILAGMTLEEKVGQMFFLRCPEADKVTAVTVWQPGGYILFGKDLEDLTFAQAVEQNASFQNASNIPMLIGVDEEGGQVVRVSKFTQFRSERFLSPQALFAAGGWEMVRSESAEKAELLLQLGINVNLAPVCDVSTDPLDFIYDRSFGMSAAETSIFVATVVDETGKHHVGSVLKHFPGYGDNEDTHTGIALDNRSYDTFTASDFLPFIAGIEAGAGSVMVSHNIVACMDENFPASLSPAVHQILRDELNFAGVIMTDDLCMGAILDYTGDTEAAVMAVLAGNDMIISTDFEVQIPAVIQAVQNGEIPESIIDASVIRILMWKLSLDIIA